MIPGSSQLMVFLYCNIALIGSYEHDGSVCGGGGEGGHYGRHKNQNTNSLHPISILRADLCEELSENINI